MPAFRFPKDARVTTTGTFRFLTQPRTWIQERGGVYIPWSSHITHIIIGSNPNTWKLGELKKSSRSVQFLNESELFENVETDLWVEKYKPNTSQQIIGHAQTAKDFQQWLMTFKPFQSKCAALLTGPPGIGKTTTAHLVCREVGYEIVELNASDARSAKAIHEILDKAGKSAAIGSSEKTRRVIILDEVDGMSSSDRGGIAALCRFLKAGTAFPIVCIANERTSPKLRGLAANCLDIRFSRPTKTTIAKTLLNGVVKKESLAITQAELETLCEQNGNDIRSILNSLQFSGYGAGTKDEILRTDIFSATGKLFGRVGKTLDEKMSHVFLDASLIPLMVQEGYIQAADKSREPKDTGLERCWKAADCLSTWDTVDKRIRRTQAWGLLPSATLAVVHAAETVKGPAPFQIFPAWLGKFSKQQKHRRYVKEIQQSMSSAETGLIDSRDLLKAKLYDTNLSPSDVIHTLHDLQISRDVMFDYLPDLSFSDSQPTMDTKKKATITREWNKLHASKLEKSKEKHKGIDSDNEDLESIVSDVDEFIEE